MKKAIIFAILYCIVGLISAQHYKTNDTIRLGEVNKIVRKKNYAVSSNFICIDSIKLSEINHNTLADVLKMTVPFHLKENAGGLSSLSIRGTSNKHTSVMFGCLDINSMSLGSSNTSVIPTFLFEKIDINLGSGSSLYGSGSIGGTIKLNSENLFNKGFNTFLNQDLGSFNRYFSGLKHSYSNNTFGYSIKAYNISNKNDFTYFDKLKDKTFTQRNASLNNWGILVNFRNKIAPNSTVKLNVWYEENWHQKQFIIPKNRYANDQTPDDVISNKHTRILLSYNYLKNNYFHINNSIGYVKDVQIDNRGYKNTIGTNRIVNNFEIDFFKIKNLNIKSGYLFKYIKPDVYAYKFEDDKKDYELKELHFFLMLKKKIFNRITISGIIRKMYYSDFDDPFTNSLNLSILALKFNHNSLKLKTGISKNVKVPTLNERFWDGYNPIKNEYTHNNIEAAIEHLFITKNFKLKHNLNFYTFDVKNLILWDISTLKPYNNKNKIKYKGIEYVLNSTHKYNLFNVSNGITYSYTSAKDVKTNLQNIYTPWNIFNAYTDINYKQNKLKLNYRYTGKRRYKEDLEKYLPSYSLFDIAIARSIKTDLANFSFEFETKNIFNTQYESWKDYAMPGRNYRFSIKINI